MRYNSKEDYKLITRFHKDLLDPIEINGVLMPDRPTVTAEVNGVVKTDLRPIMGEDVAYAMELFCNLWLWCPECSRSSNSPWKAFGLLEGNSIKNFWRIPYSSNYAAGPSCYWLAMMFLRYGWNEIPGHEEYDYTEFFSFITYTGIPNMRCILVNDNSKSVGIDLEETSSRDLWFSLFIRIHSGRTYEKNGKTYYTVEFEQSARISRITYDGPYIDSNGKLVIDATYEEYSGTIQEYRAEMDQDVFSASMHQVVGVLKHGGQIVGDASVYEVGDCSSITTNNAVVQQSSNYYDDHIHQFFICAGCNFDILRKKFDYTVEKWREDREKEKTIGSGNIYRYPLTARELKWGLDNIGIYNNLIISGTCPINYFIVSNNLGRPGYIIDALDIGTHRYATSFTKQEYTLKDDLSGIEDNGYSVEPSDHFIVHIGMVKNVKMLIQLYYRFYNTVDDSHFDEEYITYCYDVEKFRTKDSNGLDILDIYAPTFFSDIKSYMRTKFSYTSYDTYHIEFDTSSNFVFVGSFNYGT